MCWSNRAVGPKQFYQSVINLVKKNIKTDIAENIFEAFKKIYILVIIPLRISAIQQESMTGFGQIKGHDPDPAGPTVLII